MPCPSNDDLSNYLLGKLPHELSSRVDEHLEVCQQCLAQLETCETGGDTFLAALAMPVAGEPFLAEEECADALSRVVAIGHEPSFATKQRIESPNLQNEELGEIGPYRLLVKLGAGGMGTVYKALHTKLKRVVAIKVLPTDRIMDTQAVSRFEREMEAVGQLSHPNIVQAHDAGEHDGRHFLVMEHIDGTDLSDLVQQHGPLPVADACEIVRLSAIGLQHAHENGLVHRDIKPANIMLTNDGEVRILDLGLALLTDVGDGLELTSTGQAMGTLDYMAPEQGDDSHDVDIRADIYSLGATLYKLLSGHAIFSGPEYRTRMQKWQAMVKGQATPIESNRPDIPPELGEIVQRMIARLRSERFETPTDVAEALQKFTIGADLAALAAAAPPEKIEATPIGVSHSTLSMREQASIIDTVPESQAPRTQRPTEIEQPEPRRQSRPPSQRRWIAGAIGLLLLGVVSLGANFIIHWNDGTIIIEIADDIPPNEISVVVSRNGEEVAVASETKGWTLKLNAEAYDLQLGNGKDKFELEQDKVIVTSRGRETISVTIRKAISNSVVATQTPQPEPTNIGRPVPPTHNTSPPTPTVTTDEELIVDHPRLLKLRRRVEAVTSNDLDNEATVALRKDLVDVQTEVLGQPASVKIGQLMSQIPWPADALKRDDIPEYELERLGNGTPQPRGMTMVEGVLGDSRMMHWASGNHGPGPDVFWMPDGKTILSVGGSGRVSLWDTSSGRETGSYWGRHGNRSRYYGVDLSEDGRLIAIGAFEPSGSNVVKVLDARTGQEKQSIEPMDSNAYGVIPSLSPDARLLAIATTGEPTQCGIEFWNMATGELIQRFADEPTTAVEFSPDGRLLATGSVNGVLRIRDIASGETKLQVDDLGRQISGLSFSPDGSTIVVPVSSSKQPHGFRGYNVADGTVKFETKVDYPCTRFVFHPDGKKFFGASLINRLWDAETGADRVKLDVYARKTQSGAFSPDGMFLATGDVAGAVLIWNTVTGRLHRPDSDQSQRSAATAVAVSLDGSEIVTAGVETLLVRNIESGQLLCSDEWTSTGGFCKSLVFASSRSTIGLVNTAGSSFVIAPPTRTPSAVRPILTDINASSMGVDRLRNRVYFADFGFDESVITVREWDARTEQIVRNIRLECGHSYDRFASFLAFRQDSRQCALLTPDGLVTVYDLPSGTQRLQFQAGTSAAGIDYGPTGRKLIVRGGSLCIVDATNGNELLRKGGFGGPHSAVSPDGSLLAVAGGGQVAYVLSLESGKQKFQFHLGPINGLAFTPDSRHLVTANGNGTAYIIRLRSLGE